MLVIQGYGDVLGAVLLEARAVVSIAVDLHADLALHHQVNALQGPNRHLRCNAISRESETSTRQTLRQRLTGFVNPVPNSAALERQSKDQCFEIDRVQLLGVECPIETRDCVFEFLVKYHSLQGVEQTDRHSCSALRLATRDPVENYAPRSVNVKSPVPIVLRAKAGRVVVYRDVQGMLAKNPASHRADCRDSCKPPADSNGS